MNMRKEVEVIAHACGVPEPRRLRRFHARIVQDGGNSVPFNELFPSPDETDNDPGAAIAASAPATPARLPAGEIAVPAQS
jgi:hypothetical protein